MKNIYIIFVAFLTLAAGCSRYLENEELPFSLPTEPPVPIMLQVTHLNNSVRLSWQLTDSSAVSFFRIYTADSLNGDYRLHDSTSSGVYAKILTGLTAGRPYYFKVATVTGSKLEGAKSSAVSAVLGAVSVIINAGDTYTRSLDVSVRFVVPVTATLMQVSENQSFAGAAWEDFTSPSVRTLSSGDGVKRLYARFQFVDGSESDGTASDSIILDTRANIDSVYFQGPSGTLTRGDAVTFFIRTGETDGSADISFTGVTNLTLFDDGTSGDLTANDGIYSRRYIVPINLDVVNGVVTGRFRDAAGNDAPSRPASTLINIANPPTAVSLNAKAESSGEIRLNWSQAIDNDFAAYRLYRSLTSAVSESSTLITTITSRSTTSFVDTDLNEETRYHYRIYVYDNTGLTAGSLVASDSTFNNLPPTAVMLAGRGEDQSSILTWSVNNDDDFDSYLVYRGTVINFTEANGNLLTIINSPTGTSFTDTRPDAQTYYYRIYVKDRQGLTSPSNTVAIP
ncbi:MAG: fibronectin type III domain-containing protein [bacterium]|jgi:fibronectin type 3 domain-containing protein